MIIKNILKSGVIPEAYKILFKSKPSSKPIMSGISEIFTPAAFATKTAKGNAAGFTTIFDKVNDISKLKNTTKIAPENIRAMNNAVSKCLDNLQGTNPREYGFLIDEVSGAVLQEGGGTSSAISLNFTISNTSINLKKAKLAVIHGHTPIQTSHGTMTLPVSLQDFIALNNTRIRKITALDKHGLHSSLEKTENFVTLSESGLENLKQKYINELLTQSPHDKTSRIKELMQYAKQHPESIAHKREIANRLEELQYQDGADIIIDGFWRKHANSYGLKYTSDFNL